MTMCLCQTTQTFLENPFRGHSLVDFHGNHGIQANLLESCRHGTQNPIILRKVDMKIWKIVLCMSCWVVFSIQQLPFAIFAITSRLPSPQKIAHVWIATAYDLHDPMTPGHILKKKNNRHSRGLSPIPERNASFCQAKIEDIDMV